MSKSPTLRNIDDNFSKIKGKLGMKKDKSDSNMYGKGRIIFIVLYLFVTLTALICAKPKIICKEKKPYDTDEKREICYSNLSLFYLLLQIPLVIYLMCSF